MSNSSLVNYTKLSPCKSSPRNHVIDTITIHCMAGNLTVESCGALFQNRSRETSSNYGIGSDGRIGLYVNEADRSWCTSSRTNDNRDKNLIGQVDKQNMTVHRWFAAKACPGDYLYGAHPRIVEEVNKRLAGKTTKPINQNEVVVFKPFLVKVSIPALRIRKGPGTNFAPTGKYTGRGIFTIVDVIEGPGSKSGWGKLKSGMGWISLDYAKKL